MTLKIEFSFNSMVEVDSLISLRNYVKLYLIDFSPMNYFIHLTLKTRFVDDFEEEKKNLLKW